MKKPFEIIWSRGVVSEVQEQPHRDMFLYFEFNVSCILNVIFCFMQEFLRVRNKGILVLCYVLHAMKVSGVQVKIMFLAFGHCVVLFHQNLVVSKWIAMPVDLLLLSSLRLERFVEKADLAHCGNSHVDQLSCT